MSIDPVTTDENTGGSFNRYAYANNSPYNYIDPDGRDPAAIAATAKSYNGDLGWGKPGWRGGIGWITEFKCNIFVNRIVSQAGDAPPLVSGRQATAGELADKKMKIANWKVVTDGGPAKDGDVIAIGHEGEGYSGHTGIVVTSGGNPYTVSANSGTGTVTWNDWGFRGGQSPTIRRYIPGQGHPEDPTTPPKPKVAPKVEPKTEIRPGRE